VVLQALLGCVSVSEDAVGLKETVGQICSDSSARFVLGRGGEGGRDERGHGRTRFRMRVGREDGRGGDEEEIEITVSSKEDLNRQHLLPKGFSVSARTSFSSLKRSPGIMASLPSTNEEASSPFPPASLSSTSTSEDDEQLQRMLERMSTHVPAPTTYIEDDDEEEEEEEESWHDAREEGDEDEEEMGPRKEEDELDLDELLVRLPSIYLSLSLSPSDPYIDLLTKACTLSRTSSSNLPPSNPKRTRSS